VRRVKQILPIVCARFGLLIFLSVIFLSAASQQLDLQEAERIDMQRFSVE
jgi:hypothetical protein